MPAQISMANLSDHGLAENGHDNQRSQRRRHVVRNAERLNKTMAEVMQAIPVRGQRLGDSPGRSNQLSRAPQTGIKNFHKLSSDTFTPGRRRSLNQMEKADADRKDSHERDIQNGQGL